MSEPRGLGSPPSGNNATPPIHDLLTTPPFQCVAHPGQMTTDKPTAGLKELV